jgi:hypothetical protein
VRRLWERGQVRKRRFASPKQTEMAKQEEEEGKGETVESIRLPTISVLGD